MHVLDAATFVLTTSLQAGRGRWALLERARPRPLPPHSPSFVLSLSSFSFLVRCLGSPMAPNGVALGVVAVLAALGLTALEMRNVQRRQDTAPPVRAGPPGGVAAHGSGARRSSLAPPAAETAALGGSGSGSGARPPA